LTYSHYAISLPNALKDTVADEAYTVTTSVAPRVRPTVMNVESDAGTVAPYTMYSSADNAEPATRTAMRYVAAVDAWLHTEIVDTTVCVADGTVYRVVAVVALGLT
jgi:hypothetical protein